MPRTNQRAFLNHEDTRVYMKPVRVAMVSVVVTPANTSGISEVCLLNSVNTVLFIHFMIQLTYGYCLINPTFSSVSLFSRNIFICSGGAI
jgi:hypothetical protein